MLQNSRIVAASTAASPTNEANSRCHVTASGSFEVICRPYRSHCALPPRRPRALEGRPPLVMTAIARGVFRAARIPVASYSAGRDIAAKLISEPSTGTNLDVAAADQSRPSATRAAKLIHPMRRIFIPHLGKMGLAYFSPSECEVAHTSRGINGGHQTPTGPRRPAGA